MAKVAVRKSVLISSGQYENVRVECEFETQIEGDSVADLQKEAGRLTEVANNYLREEVDAVELKTRKAQSKASRYGL